VNFLLTLFYFVTFIIIAAGMLMLVYYPLAIIAELRPRRNPVFDTPSPLVSIIVPAYNEEKVIANCVNSILTSTYKNYEIFLVDDGSTDETLKEMRKFRNIPQVKVLTQINSGKASALNQGFQHSKGEILFFVDADGIFLPNTIQEMLFGFSNARVGAVCGSDSPVNLDRPLTKLMAIQTHVGTGFVRRALAEINCLPIVSGNIGAFRRSVLEKTLNAGGLPIKSKPERLWPFMRIPHGGEPFARGFIGEDLELTWRIHRAGYRVNFAPHAIVQAEVPSSVKNLWKQRVRWARGLLQTVILHRDMFFNRKYGMMGLYLPINFLNMVIIPILQLLIVFLVIVLAIAGFSPIQLGILNLILWVGLSGALFTVFFSIALDRAWKDLKYFYVIPLWVPYSLMMDAVTIWAIILELRGTEAKWNKFERTGVVSGRTKPKGRKSN
jgi:poly-beta-1,6-N-acetyl-D-glucosamine synthase